MPEGPEVLHISDILRENLVGKYFMGLKLHKQVDYLGKCVKTEDNKYMYFKRGIFEEIYAKGKKIFFKIRLKNRVIYLFSSLGLFGQWSFTEVEYLKITLYYSTKKKYITNCAYYGDKTNYGLFQVIQTDEEMKHILKSTGPSYLTDNISFESFEEKVRNKRIKNKEIGIFLMEQKYFSGIGNYLLCEILYFSKLNPHRTLESLTDKNLKTLYKTIHEIIFNSYKSKGLTFSDYIDPNNQKGLFQVYVYKNKIDPLGNNIITETMSNGRTIHWVPEIQI